MHKRKVRLYIRIRGVDGRDMYAEPTWTRNHSLKAGYVTVAGRPKHHPEAPTLWATFVERNAYGAQLADR